MMRHRTGDPSPPPAAASSSSDEEDAFSAFSSKKRKKKTGASSVNASSKAVKKEGNEKPTAAAAISDGDQQKKSLPVYNTYTSSMKRHHGEASDTRKAKLDAILLELEAEKDQVRKEPARGGRNSRKKGSFVDEGDELLTTNLFVSNLAPSITEEQMAELFRQFGDLYSVKIMWPRTQEESLRDRNTGFVCFMNRSDAEDAMEACSEADPFNVGRRLLLRWGKHVKKSAGGAPIVKKGTGGIVDAVPLPALQQKNASDQANYRAAAALEASLNVDQRSSIRVVPPQDKRRALFIATVASFVAKDGEQLERTLAQREAQNPAFAFLTLSPEANETQKQEHVFYKWRVYSFCQGDGFHTWRSEPFQIFSRHGCTWIPPPVDIEAARREEEEAKRKQEDIERQKQQRRFLGTKRNFLTGRQIEQARKGPDGGAKLMPEEMKDFDRLFRQELCASRESICRAMAFCFEKSSAAKHISDLLRGLFVDIAPGTSVDTLIARLFLISDVLFNSQQPGIRNAFLYRSAIQTMSPDAFQSLGAYARSNFRFTGRKRLTSSVMAVLGAWANWGVFDFVFFDELQARFEGKDISASQRKPKDAAAAIQTDDADADADAKSDSVKDESAEESAFTAKPRGEWTAIVAGTKPETDQKLDKVVSASGTLDDSTGIGEKVRPHNQKPDGGTTNKDLNGETLLEEEDGEPLDGESLDDEADGEALDEGPDGEPLDDEGLDGAPLDDDQDGDGEPLREDLCDS